MAESSKDKPLISKSLKIVAIVLAAIVVVSFFTYYEVSRTVPPKKESSRIVGYLGPKVDVMVNNGKPVLNNNTTINVQMFFPVPASFKDSLYGYNVSTSNQSSNGADDMVLNVTLTPENNTSSFFMNPTFNNITNEWRDLFFKYEGTNYPSLTVEALKTVVDNGTAKIFQYYNNFPFNPAMQGMTHFNITKNVTPVLSSYLKGTQLNLSRFSSLYISDINFTLNLTFPSQPIQTVIMDNASSYAVSHSDLSSPLVNPLCSGKEELITRYVTETVNTLKHTETFYYILPLGGIHIGRRADDGNSQVVFGGSIFVLNGTIGLNSNQVYVSSSGEESTTMSTSPSFMHVVSINVSASGNATSTVPTKISEILGDNSSNAMNRTTAFVGIQGAEYQFSHYVRNTYTYKLTYQYIYPNCLYLISDTLVSAIYDGNSTIGEIININSTAGIQITAEDVPIPVAWTVQHALLQSSNGTIQLKTKGNGEAYQSSTLWAITSGWTNATNGLKKTAEAMKLFYSFSSPLSLGLAVVDGIAAVNEFDLGERAVIAESLSLIASTIGLAATILNQFSSISFIDSTQYPGGTIYSFNNYNQIDNGSNYTMPLYESSYPVTFTVQGSEYSFYAPENYYNATEIS